MGRTLKIILLSLLMAVIVTAAARAQDVALVLSPSLKTAMIQVFGIALQASPNSSPTITILLDRINSAPTIVHPSDEPPKEEEKK